MHRHPKNGLFLRFGLILAGAALSAAASASTQSPGAPVLAIADPHSLDSSFTFGTLPPQAGGQPRGAIHWQVDIALPRHAVLDHADVYFTQPPVLHLKDSRCFRIEVDEDSNARFHLKAARSVQIDCPAARNVNDPDLKPIERPGMRYLGRAFDLDAYVDAKSGRTLFFQTGQKDSVPLLSTQMHVLGLGAMGCPDCGATDLRLLGTVGRRLVLVDVAINVAYA